MEIIQFEQSIETIFKGVLEEFDDDYGFTYKAEKSINTIGYSTNISLEVIEKAAENNVDLIVTHHDAWDFIFGLKEACVKKLKEYNISHFWIHGPLDFIEFGTSTSLMSVLGVNHVERYSIYKDGHEFPGIGKFSAPLHLEMLVARLKNQLEEPVKVWKNNDKMVSKIGVLTGAGHSSTHLRYALEQGCDTYITGEATLYTIQYAKFAGINLLVGSHTFTEIFGVENLAKKLEEHNKGITILRLNEEHFESIPK